MQHGSESRKSSGGKRRRPARPPAYWQARSSGGRAFLHCDDDHRITARPCCPGCLRTTVIPQKSPADECVRPARMIVRNNLRRSILFVTAILVVATSVSSEAVPTVLPVAPGDVPTTCADPGSSCGPDRYCSTDPSTASSSEYYCLHKSLAGNAISLRDVLALLLVAGCCFLAAMGGIGGGGLLFPLITMVCNFTPKEAIVLSHAGVFGNCLGQATFYVGSSIASRHRRNLDDGGDNKGRMLYQSVSAAVLVILPGLLAGGSAAITLQGLVPSTAILILALLTLTLGVIKTTVKARKMWREEEDAALGQASHMATDETTLDGVEEEGSGDDNALEEAFEYKAMESKISDANTVAREEDGVEADTQGSHASELRKPCCRGLFGCTVEKLILSCWALDAVTFIAQRSSSITKCSAAYFVVVFLPLLFGLLFVWRGRVLLIRRNQILAGRNNDEERQQALEDNNPNHEADAWGENEIENTSLNQVTEHHAAKSFDVLVWWLPLASFIVGLISALLGIGGGEILGPTLLLLNMNPQHSSTTTSVVALLNSGTNTLHNATAGLIISPAYFASIWSMGLVSGGAGRAFSMILSSRSGKNSIIAFSLAMLLAIASALVAIELFTTPPEWGSEGVC